MERILHILLNDQTSCGECGHPGGKEAKGDHDKDVKDCVESVMEDGKSESEAYAICNDQMKESSLKTAFVDGFSSETEGAGRESLLRMLSSS
jgi:hypothetical protein